MGNAILISIVAVTIVLPLACARDRSRRRGLKRVVAFLLAFGLLYVVLVTRVFARLYVPEVW